MKLDFNVSDLTILTFAEEDSAPRREIQGIALPWDTVATESHGTRVLFRRDSILTEGPRPKLLWQHDPLQPRGIVTELVSTETALLFTAKISATPEGDSALQLAADGVLSVSVGVNPTTYNYEQIDGVETLVVEAGEMLELSLVTFPAFEQAAIEKVAASQPNQTPKEVPQVDEVTQIEAPAEIVPTQPIAFSASAPKVTASEVVSALATGNVSPRIQAALAEQGTADTPGIIPEIWTGEVFNPVSNARPLIDSIGLLAMPRAGGTFYRRKVTQNVAVDEQVAEFDEIESQKMLISKIQVDKKTLAGGHLMSEQEIDWSDPAAVQLVLNDYARIWRKRTEQITGTALVTAASVTDEITDWTDGDEILDALYDASAAIDAVIDELPTTVWVDPLRWADLGKAKNAAGDRIFPVVGPSNAAGTMSPGSYAVNALGLRVVVSNRLPADTFIIGNPMGIELFEDLRGAITVQKPSILAVELAYRGYFATATIESGAFVALVDPA
jgi:HK97 family phage prohead protease